MAFEQELLKEDKDIKNNTSVRSLERALDLLEFLEKKGTPSGVRAIESETGIPKATAQRLLNVLETRGFVHKQNGKYMLWISSVRLAKSFLRDHGLISTARPYLKALTMISDENASLYIQQGYYRILVERIESPNPLRFQTQLGERLPLYLGASGQVLCSRMPRDELNEYFSKIEPVPLANGKLLYKKDLIERVDIARNQGYAIGVDERFKEVTSVAVSIDTKDPKILAAINIAGPSYRLPEVKLSNITMEILGAAKELSDVYQRNFLYH